MFTFPTHNYTPRVKGQILDLANCLYFYIKFELIFQLILQIVNIWIIYNSK